MDQPSESAQPDLLKRYPRPAPTDFVIWDDAKCFDDQENAMNRFLHLGFEPYAVTQTVDDRDEAIAKMKLSGKPTYRYTRWLRRPRNPKDQQLPEDQQ